MKIDEDIISYDFQGWPNYKMNLREILKSIGAFEKDGILGFETDSNILDKYPYMLEDDGMGYGVNKSYVTSAANETDTSEIQAFIEKPVICKNKKS